ncbi:MAG: putative 2-dehydropantoate 2-reductase [Bacteroidaceae bacterium]|nr:putative 2-dehydropantoate 2-reductase [Bacteroidaceae bacterium]
MRYAVIGTGAIGGYYGAKLAQSGQEVHFLLHSDYRFVLEHGLQVNSCDGSFHLDKPQVYASTADMPQCDVVLVGLKSVNNHLLPSLLPPLLKKDTLVILIQNGLGLEDDLQQQMPDLHLAAGLAFICSAKTEPGTVDHQCYGYINIGNYSCPNPQLVEQVVSHFCAAGIDAHTVEYHEARWKKAVWNMPFNGMTVALNTQTDLLLANPATRQLIYSQMLEVIHAAQACGVENIDESFADKMIYNTEHMTPYSPSMKLDYEYGRPMEIHYLYTRPLQMARASGCPMPQLEMLEAELQFLQK